MHTYQLSGLLFGALFGLLASVVISAAMNINPCVIPGAFILGLMAWKFRR